MPRPWMDVLHQPAHGEHAAQIYGDGAELGASVAAYLAAGFAAGDPAVVIATAAHWSEIARQLGKKGWDAADLRERGLLVIEDAEATLERLLDAGRPSAARFERIVGGTIERIASRHPGKQVRAFGEMVDVVCRRGEPEVADALEQLWNALARRRRDFTLLCAYRVDIFDRKAQVATLPAVCRAHSRVQPTVDADRFSRAVEEALDDVLGAEDAGKVYVLIADEIRRDRVPVGELALMWVSENMPARSEVILARARARYTAAA